jgi:hypothetical protein
MKLTVGPLPPAVYWRRRVVLLAGLLLVVLLATSLCSTSTSGKAQQGRTRTAGDQSSAGPDPTPTATVLTPTTGNPNDAPTSAPPPAATAAAPPPAPVVPPPTGPCTDAEISVVAAPASATVKTGVPLKIFLKVKNVSNRACSRDVGADAQELIIQQNKAKVWSSDDCAPQHGTDMKAFTPGLEVSFFVNWDAKSSAAGCDKRAFLAPGTYQVVARLTAKYSDPVNLTIQA